jgi:hypothetical protein
LRELLSSPRRRRRLARIALAVVVVGAAVTAGIVFRGGKSLEYAGPAATGPAQTIEVDVPAPFTKQVRAEVLPIASRFVATAVERKDLDEAWTLVHPLLRQDYTLERWRTGEIPVVPFPVAAADWDLQYSYRDTIGLYVLLYPRRGQKLEPTTFMLEMKNVGDARRHRWLVSSWVPAPGAAEAAAGARAAGSQRLAIADGAFDQGRLSPLWLILPVAGTLGLLLALVAFFVVRSSLRNRRAMRAYARTTPLPPLPGPKA